MAELGLVANLPQNQIQQQLPGVISPPINRLRPVPYFPDMSGWTSGPIFSGEVRFFPDIDRGTSGGGFVNYAEPMTHVFRCF